MTPLELRAAILRAWPPGQDRLTTSELQAVQAVVDGASPMMLPSLIRSLYNEVVTAKALHWGNLNAVADALTWRSWIPPGSTDDLAQKELVNAQQLGEPLFVPVAAREELQDAPQQVLTVEGWMRFEEDYLPRVCTSELGQGDPEAKAAQVIAARTFVLRAMRDHPTLGRTTPIRNTTRFQTFAKGAGPECIEATERTRGMVMRHGGRLILANYVAGAPWQADGSPGKDQSGTERWVTYNGGKIGADVKPSRLTLSTNPCNRGCMSQNGANWLAQHGWVYDSILRFFYGEDIEIGTMTDAHEASRSGVIGLVALTALGIVVAGGRL